LTLNDVKSGIVAMIKKAFPTIKIYSLAVVEKYKRPAFFIQLKPTTMEPDNYNTRRNQMTLYIDYFQQTVDEYDILDVIDKLRDLFGLSILIEDRHIDVTGFDYDLVGTDRNVPEISIDLEWSDRIDHTVIVPTMTSLGLDETLEEE